jgi:hypothetical protein
LCQCFFVHLALSPENCFAPPCERDTRSVLIHHIHTLMLTDRFQRPVKSSRSTYFQERGSDNVVAVYPHTQEDNHNKRKTHVRQTTLHISIVQIHLSYTTPAYPRNRKHISPPIEVQRGSHRSIHPQQVIYISRSCHLAVAQADAEHQNNTVPSLLLILHSYIMSIRLHPGISNSKTLSPKRSRNHIQTIHICRSSKRGTTPYAPVGRTIHPPSTCKAASLLLTILSSVQTAC